MPDLDDRQPWHCRMSHSQLKAAGAVTDVEREAVELLGSLDGGTYLPEPGDIAKVKAALWRARAAAARGWTQTNEYLIQAALAEAEKFNGSGLLPDLVPRGVP